MTVIEIEILVSEQCSFIHSMNNSVEHISPKSRFMDYLVQTTLYNGLFQQSKASKERFTQNNNNYSFWT